MMNGGQESDVLAALGLEYVGGEVPLTCPREWRPGTSHQLSLLMPLPRKVVCGVSKVQVWNAGSAVWDGDELLAGGSVEGRRVEGSEDSEM